MEKQVLTFDFGASSGRAMMGKFDGSRIELTEVHRFDNNPVMLRGTFYWDAIALFHEIKQGITEARSYGEFSSIGIDTWGVDFGLLDENGDLLQNPIHYRDVRSVGMSEEMSKEISMEDLYNATGVEVLEINTIFQLYSIVKKHPELLKRAGCMLMMPDLFGYFLTGKKTAEYSVASTTQILDPAKGNWNLDLLRRLNIPVSLFPEVVPSGTVLGEVSPEICKELGIHGVKVISIAGHDTTCAVVAAPARQEDFIFISCGTWSLFGTELKTPIISDESRQHNITNEGGYNGNFMFLKNLIGLWLIQETRRQYRREGKEYSYNDLEKFSVASEPFQYFIDPNAQEFVAPGNIPERIRSYCQRTGQGTPKTVGEIMRCIYESLAMTYRYTLEQIQDCTGKTYRDIHMLGGGTKDTLLCGMTANSTGCRIIAGPIEATAMGNVAVQLIAQGDIANLAEARKVISNSFETVEYLPEDIDQWSRAYKRYRAIIEKVEHGT
jgi:rhamnulokinase